jgi:RNA recognition motif-containing protein
MAFEKQSGKVSGRTPEQQAARDARKAAKKASEVASTSVDITVDKEGDNAEPTSTEPETQGESSTAETKKRKHNTDIEELEVDLEAPTPLNKKEARLAKKKAKRGDDGDEILASADIDAKPKAVPVEKRNSIWIGNLSFRTTGDRIKEFLENGVKELGGDEGCVTRVNLPKEKNKGEFGPSKGYVFSSFILPSSSHSSLLFTLKIRLSCLESHMMYPIVRMSSSIPIPSFAIKSTLKGANSRFAFVDFSSPENQKLAVDLSEKLLEGRKLLIKLGTLIPLLQLFLADKTGNDHTSNPEARTPKPIKQKGIEKQPHGESSTLFVGNLPFDATEDGLRDMIEASAASASGSAGGAGAKGKSKKAESDSDDEAEEEKEDVKEEGDKEKEKELKGANRGGKLSGLRKVRLGAFEDTGRCKGLVFFFCFLPSTPLRFSLPLHFPCTLAPLIPISCSS